MKKISMFFMSLVVSLGVFVAVPQLASAATAKSTVCDGIGATTGADGCSDGSGKSINDILAMVINIFSWFVGVVAVIFVIVGAFKYITSGGDASAVKSAKDTLLYAIIGLVIVAVAQVLVQFVLTKSNQAVNKTTNMQTSYIFDKLA
ncbi:hypothetical protein KBC51_02805 [Candidatus Saccharibacteria bacterium]|jgi:ABC-type Fe3+ transport system permease subunit|nr:hypothetical protein [Candidatus Saccharibacteria bacterium]